jgi:hypothetical protein
MRFVTVVVLTAVFGVLGLSLAPQGFGGQFVGNQESAT